MKIEIPEKVRIIITVTERIGVPTILCLVFAYIYFTKLQKLVEDFSAFRSDAQSVFAIAKADHEEIKREVRRSQWGGRDRVR